MSISVKSIQPKVVTRIEEPPIAKFLFADTRMAWLWFIVRMYVGYQWITAGWEKMIGSGWVFSAHDGAGLKGFVTGALAQTVLRTSHFSAGVFAVQRILRDLI